MTSRLFTIFSIFASVLAVGMFVGISDVSAVTCDIEQAADVSPDTVSYTYSVDCSNCGAGGVDYSIGYGDGGGTGVQVGEGGGYGEHTYSQSGTYTVEISCNFDNADNNGPSTGYKEFFFPATVGGGEENPPPECSDGSDNDGDGDADYPDDVNCDDLNDDNEAGPTDPECRDGIDNDGDGLTDFNDDPGCNNSNDDDEFNQISNPPPTVDITCDGAQSCTVDYGSTTALSWSSSDADVCYASDGWSGVKGTSGSETSQVLTSSSTTFTITCDGPYGQGYDSVVVQIPDRMSRCVEHSIPSAMTTNQSQAAYLTWRNAGTMTWTNPNFDYTMWPWPAPDPGLAPTFGEIAGAPIAPGQTMTVNFNVTAPSTPGTYYGHWRLLEQNVEWFGATCGVTNVVVTEPVNDPPTATSVSVTEQDYCSNGPSAVVQWQFSDPDAGDSQTAYQVQVGKNGNFNGANLKYDSGKISNAGTSQIASGQTMAYAETYKARVRVWDEQDEVSAWTLMSVCTPYAGQADGCNGETEWTTAQHAYPQNVNFTWTPAEPEVNEEVQFDDSTTQCYGFFGIPAACATYVWDFGDGTPGSGPAPTHTYTVPDDYTVTMQVTDDDDYTCPKTPLAKPLTASKRYPTWKEVLPR